MFFGKIFLSNVILSGGWNFKRTTSLKAKVSMKKDEETGEVKKFPDFMSAQKLYFLGGKPSKETYVAISCMY